MKSPFIPNAAFSPSNFIAQEPLARDKAVNNALCLRVSRYALAATIGLTGLVTPASGDTFDVNDLAPSTISLSGVNYFSAPVFADAMRMAAEWQEDYPGTTPPNRTLKPIPGDLTPIGLPVASAPSQVFTTFFQGTNDRSVLIGRWVVEWTGTADITLTGAGISLLSSNVTATGGKRIYNFPGNGANTGRPTIRATGISGVGLTSLKVWLPHPDSPATYSLEPGERASYNASAGIVEPEEAFYFSPVLIRILKERPWGAIRFMDFLETNHNPVRNWAERRLPTYISQTSGILPRDPVTGAWNGGLADPKYNDPGVAWEYAIALCNVTGRNLWLTVPHLGVISEDGLYGKLANLVAYGSNANGVPYASTYTGPKVFKGLNPDLEVYLEYSNEVWNGKFSQQKFANNQRTDTGVPEQIAINSLIAWKAFESVPALRSASVDRIVRLLGVQPRNGANTTTSLRELYTSGKDGEASTCDAITCGAYFGNNIELYVRDVILEGALWPGPGLPGAIIEDTNERNPIYTYPEVAYARYSDPSGAYYRKVFDEWTRRILVGDGTAGNSYDTTGRMGGVDPEIYAAAALWNDPNGQPLRVIATEGGASIYTDTLDGGNDADDLLTDFVVGFVTHERMPELLRAHLEFGRSRGLRSFNIYTLTGDASKYGQWGVLELNGKHSDPTDARSRRYRVIRDWFDEFRMVRHVDLRIGTAPAFTVPEDLGELRVNSAANYSLPTTNANKLEIIAKVLVPGLTANVTGTTATITGTPTKPGLNLVLLRALDADGDPTWRVYRLNVKHWSQNNFFNNMTAHPAPVDRFVVSNRYVFETEDGTAGLQISPITVGSINHVLRVTAPVATCIGYNTGSADPLANQPFNLDSLRVGRSNSNVIGVRLEAVSETGNVTTTMDIPLTGAINSFFDVVLDSRWDNLYAVVITFYDTRTAIPGTSNPILYNVNPAANGFVDDVKINF